MIVGVMWANQIKKDILRNNAGEIIVNCQTIESFTVFLSNNGTNKGLFSWKFTQDYLRRVHIVLFLCSIILL